MEGLLSKWQNFELYWQFLLLYLGKWSKNEKMFLPFGPIGFNASPSSVSSVSTVTEWIWP